MIRSIYNLKQKNIIKKKKTEIANNLPTNKLILFIN